ncbi:MAG: ABC transporter permease, partial [Limisphaerales bacterium]
MGKLQTPIWESVKISLSSLRANKLRSILTLIGVIIGVMSIITMVSLISGFNKLVADQLATLGSTTFIVEKFGIILSEDDWFDAMKRKDLTLADYQAVVDGCSECEEVAIQKASNRKVKYGREHFSRVPIVGITPNYMKVVALDDIVDKGQGRVITEFEYDHRRQVV